MIGKARKNYKCKKSSGADRMHAYLDKIIYKQSENSCQKYSEIKELKNNWLITKAATQIPHPPIKNHRDNVWNNAILLFAQKNITYKF